MKSSIFYTPILLVLGLSISGLTNVGAQIKDTYWSKITLPQRFQGRWYDERTHSFLDLDEYGITRDGQTWPYQQLQSQQDTLGITLKFRGQKIRLKIYLDTLKNLKLKCNNALFFPAYDILDYSQLRRWSPKGDSPATFRELAELQANSKFSDGSMMPQANIALNLLNEEWIQRAQPLLKFPTALCGNWQHIHSKNETLNISIFPGGLLTRQTKQKPYPVLYNELQHLYEYDGVYVASFKSDRYPDEGVLCLKYRADSLTIQFFGFSDHTGESGGVYTKIQALRSAKLPGKLQRSYALNESRVPRNFPSGLIYIDAGRIKVGQKDIKWEKHQLDISAVYENPLILADRPAHKSYDLVLQDPANQKQYFASIIHNAHTQRFDMYLFGIPRKSPDGGITIFPWKFYRPQLGDLSEKQLTMLVLGSPLLALLLGAFIWVYTGQLRRQQQHAQLALRGVRAQLNPHFLFNALSSIQSLVNYNDRDTANRYLSGFSKLLRHTLNHSEEDYLSLEEELKYLQQYCELEALRTPFAYTFTVDENIDIFNTEIPSMLLQPYVENAILHGLRKKVEQPRLELFFRQESKNLICEISDNGPGIGVDRAKQQNTLSTPKNLHGMGLSAERIRLLNLRLQKKISIEVIDRQQSEHQSGTRIIITIPQ